MINGGLKGLWMAATNRGRNLLIKQEKGNQINQLRDTQHIGAKQKISHPFDISVFAGDGKMANFYYFCLTAC